MSFKLGKISREVFNRIIYPNLGERREEVIIGPSNGVDTGAIDLQDGRVLVVKTDPVFIVPQYGYDKASWFAVHILASDVMTSGIPPSYALIDLNLPPKMGDEELSQMWSSMSKYMREIGVSVVGGHTGRYLGTDFPMIGGFTMMGIGKKEKLGSPTRVRPGDTVIVTKGPAIEATALLVNTYPQYFKRRLDREVFEEAMNLFWEMSCWKDGLVASRYEVHMMHDATEGGLWNALVEVAEASGKSMLIHEELIPVKRSVRDVTSLVGIDPFTSISEGTMIIITPEPESVLREIKGSGIEGEAVGEVVENRVNPGRVSLRRRDGSVKEIVRPEEDPFWKAFAGDYNT